MRLEIEHDLEPPKRRRQPPPDYTSRAIRLRLVLMLVALGLVLIAMKEVQKPERWAWMGFDQESPQAQSDRREVAEPAGSATERIESEPRTSVGPGESSVSQTGGRAEKGRPQARFEAKERDPVEADWQTIWSGLTEDEQRRLTQMFRAVRNGTAMDAEQRAACRELLEKIEQRHRHLHARALDRLARLPADADDQRETVQQYLLRSQVEWEAVRSAIETFLKGGVVPADQQSHLAIAQAAIDRAVLAAVEDHTPVARAADGLAWLRCWEQVLANRESASRESSSNAEGSSAGDSELVRVAQLLNQPNHYRGRWVFARGWLRGAQRLKVKKNELGIGHYYVLWVQPFDSDAAPFCLYVRQWPAGLPPVDRTFVKLSEPIRFRGIFFKLRSYPTVERKLAVCPLILADSVDWVAESPAAPTPRWEPPPWMLILILVGIPVVATLIAVVVYQTTRTERIELPNQTGRVLQNLAALNRDPNIKTDAERVRELEEKHRPTGEPDLTKSSE